MTDVEGVYCMSTVGPRFFVPCIPGKTSDKFHTFDELYRHRCLLFVALMAAYPELSWFSDKHDDGSSIDGWFIAGMKLPTGDITYHLPIEMWPMVSSTGLQKLGAAPRWDGHTSDDACDRIEEWLRKT